MPLVTLQTNLKSLQYGKDRPGNDSSKQPYITTPIPANGEPIPSEIGLASPDYFLRGGLNAVRDTATDLVRLGKYFSDTSSPAGLLFITKQNVLSRIGVRTQASGVGVNEGVYTPLSTLAQAGVNFIGGHLYKQGVDPFQGVRKYLDLTSNTISNSILGGVNITNEEDNRLVQLAKLKIGGEPIGLSVRTNTQISNQPGEILSYGGGPNSILGIGKTRIQIASGNKGGYLTTVYNNTKGINNFLTWGSSNLANLGTTSPNNLYKDTNWIFNFPNSPYQSTIQDFREPLIKDKKISTIMGIAPSYSKPNLRIDGPDSSRINYTDPGQPGNIINYTLGKVINKKVSTVDKINALPLYKSSAVIADPVKNDLVKFRIAALDTGNPNSKVYMHFRAFIDSFSDSYNANWNSQQYMGRGEPFYKYGNFTRDVNLSFTVAAQSRPEIMEMYRKLNFLASNLAPDYTSQGYMGGPLVQLTMGGWCYELPGFIKSLTLDVPQESPWEIAIPAGDTGTTPLGGISFREPSVKEMPMICRVTGFTFTPIHKFRPQKQNNKYGNGILVGAKGSKYKQNIRTVKEDIANNKRYDGYGPQRFIQLDDGGGNNAYDNKHGAADNLQSFINANQNLKQNSASPDSDTLNINTIDGVQPNNLV